MRTLMLLALALASALHAAELRVHPGGKDGAHTTISAAIAKASDGDSVLVAAGLYQESLLINKSISLLGEGPQFVTIAGTNADNTITIASSGYEVLIHGLTVVSDFQGVVIQANNTVKLQNVVVANCGYSGIMHSGYAASNVLLQNCTIANNKGPGLYWHPTTPGTVRLLDSIFYQNEGHPSRNGDGYQIYWFSYPGNPTISASSLYWHGNPLINTANLPLGNIALAVQKDPRFLDPANRIYLLNTDTSSAKDAGSSAHRDPDGTLADLGAYGGATAAKFWPYPLRGPVVQEHGLEPDKIVLQQGDKIKIRAEATTR